MQLTLDIPDDIYDRVLEGFCGQHGYQEKLLDMSSPPERVPNSESKVQFLERKIWGFVKESVTVHEVNQAVQVTREEKIKEVEAKILLK